MAWRTLRQIGWLVVAWGATGATNAVSLPRCLQALQPMPRDVSPATLQSAFDEAFALAGVTRDDAVSRAEATEAWLVRTVARARRGGDASVALALWALFRGRECEALGHPFPFDSPPLRSAGPRDWIRTEAEVAQALDVVAAHTKLLPGTLRPPVLLQQIPTAGGAMRPHRAMPGDGNAPAFYRGQLLLFLEEYVHLLERLRHYAGHRGPNAAVSQWARRSNVDYEVDREADAYAWLLEQWPEAVPTSWRHRYPSRSFVP